MTKESLSFLLLITVLSVSLAGCSKKPVTSENVSFPEEIPLVTTTSVSTPAESSVSTGIESSVSFETPVENEEATIDYKLVVLNQCNADIGMVCMLDPVSAEQTEIGPLVDGTALIMNFEGWPERNTTLDLAFYNNSGNLVSTTEVDITGVESTVTVSLSGNGNIEKVKGEVN